MLLKIATGLLYFFGTLAVLNILSFSTYFIYSIWTNHTEEAILKASYNHQAFIGTILVLILLTLIAGMARMYIIQAEESKNER